MYLAGDPTKAVLSNGFLRYDCTTDTLYVLVLQADGDPILTASGNAWAEIDGSSTKVYTDNTSSEPTGAAFAWVGEGYDSANPSNAEGYEAMFPLAANPTTPYTIVVHVEAGSGAGNTSAFVGFNTHTTSETVSLDPVCSDSTPTPSTPIPTPTPTPTDTPTPTPTPTPTSSPTPTPQPQGTAPTMSGPTATDPASASFTRTYLWSISETSDWSRITSSAAVVTANFATTAVRTGIRDSAWRFGGSVTIANPNPTNLDNVTVVDSVDNGGTCSVVDGTGLTILANGSVTLDYSCTWAATPSPTSGTDTATATWDPTLNNTPTSSATVDTPLTFGAPTTRVTQNVAVTDTAAGALGNLTGTDVPPDAGATFHDPRSLAVPAGGCTPYTTTGRLSTGQTAAKTVTVCSGVKAMSVGAASIGTPSAGAANGRLFAGVALLLGGLLGGALSVIRLRRRASPEAAS